MVEFGEERTWAEKCREAARRTVVVMDEVARKEDKLLLWRKGKLWR